MRKVGGLLGLNAEDPIRSELSDLASERLGRREDPRSSFYSVLGAREIDHLMPRGLEGFTVVPCANCSAGHRSRGLR